MRYDLKGKTRAFCLKYICQFPWYEQFWYFIRHHNFLKTRKLSDKSAYHHSICYYYTHRKRSWGGDVVFTLFVCLSVYLLSLNMILSMHVLKNGCMGFSDFFLKTHYSQCINVHLECSYWFDNVYKFFRLFSVYGLGHSFYE